MRAVPVLAACVLAAWAATSQADAAEWHRFELPGTSASVDIPVDIFSVDAGRLGQDNGHTFKTKDDLADLTIYAVPNAGMSPAEFLRTRSRLPASAIVYRRVTPSMVTVSGYRGDKIWYARCNFHHQMLNCLGLNYPAREKAWWDPIVTRISHSLSG